MTTEEVVDTNEKGARRRTGQFVTGPVIPGDVMQWRRERVLAARAAAKKRRKK